MLVALTALWLPILVSALFVFVAANVLWMAPFWHRKDYGSIGDSSAITGALKTVPSGLYLVPSMDWGKMTAAERAEFHKGPMGLLLLRNPAGTFSFPVALVSYFLYCVVVSVFIAYIAGVTLEPGTHYLRVFRVTGSAGIVAYSFVSFGDSIWYGKPWSVTVKTVIDGVIYGLLIAGTFGWLWPR